MKVYILNRRISLVMPVITESMKLKYDGLSEEVESLIEDLMDERVFDPEKETGVCPSHTEGDGRIWQWRFAYPNSPWHKECWCAFRQFITLSSAFEIWFCIRYEIEKSYKYKKDLVSVEGVNRQLVLGDF